MAHRHLASRVFHPEDQVRFASMSGDWNPMHMDPVAARRTAAGACVAHGAHLLLWAMESLALLLKEGSTIDTARAKFLKWTYVGEAAELFLLRLDDGEARLRIACGGVTVASITFGLGRRSIAWPASFENIGTTNASFPIARQLSEMNALSGTVDIVSRLDAWAGEFPNAAGVFGALELAGIGCASRLVGMECPGLHSIFASISVAVDQGTSVGSGLAYTVAAAHDLLRSVSMRIAGANLSGTVEAFARIPPVGQETIATIARRVQPNEFAGARALIIGGSRGLGEFCAKAIAAGGGTVTLTYAVGRVEAERIAEEIAMWGGACRTIPYDVHASAPGQLTVLDAPPTHLYYFASSAIFRSRGQALEWPLVEDFMSAYVRGLYQLCESLSRLNNSAPLTVFYPSSIAVETRPPGMTEYAMAKAAGETLCSDLGRLLPGTRVVVKRLPRLPTDQTASLIPVREASVPEILLPIIREVQQTRVNP